MMKKSTDIQYFKKGTDMKNITKIIFTVFTVIFLTASLAISAFAAEGTSDGDAGENAFELFYGFVSDNADKIFSLLAFIGALILSFAYKKGLFPFVEGALAKLTGAVGTLREETEKANAGTDEFLGKLTEKLKLSENILEDFNKRIRTLEEKLDTAALLNDKSDEMRAVMLAEVEMLYDIFISSSLPQYQKDKVGEVYQKMKSRLSEKGE